MDDDDVRLLFFFLSGIAMIVVSKFDEDLIPCAAANAGFNLWVRKLPVGGRRLLPPPPLLMPPVVVVDFFFGMKIQR